MSAAPPPNDLQRALGRQIHSLVNAWLATRFEPLVSRLYCQPKEVARVRRMLTEAAGSGSDEPRLLERPVGRGTMLLASFKHLGAIQHREELVITLGRRLGTDRTRPSRVEGFWHCTGERHSVRPTERALSVVERHINTIPRAEVMFIHNHPETLEKTVLRALVGWTAMPSAMDRATASRAFDYSVRLLDDRLHEGFFRFFLVEESELREFVLPPLDYAGMAVRVIDTAARSFR
jgi:hypothetical protein